MGRIGNRAELQGLLLTSGFVMSTGVTGTRDEVQPFASLVKVLHTTTLLDSKGEDVQAANQEQMSLNRCKQTGSLLHFTQSVFWRMMQAAVSALNMLCTH